VFIAGFTGVYAQGTVRENFVCDEAFQQVVGNTHDSGVVLVVSENLQALSTASLLCDLPF